MLFVPHASSAASPAVLTYQRTTTTANRQTAQKPMRHGVPMGRSPNPGQMPYASWLTSPSPSLCNSRMGRISCLLAFVVLRQSPFWIVFGSQDVQCACANMISREFGMQMKLTLDLNEIQYGASILHMTSQGVNHSELFTPPRSVHNAKAHMITI